MRNCFHNFHLAHEFLAGFESAFVFFYFTNRFWKITAQEKISYKISNKPIKNEEKKCINKLNKLGKNKRTKQKNIRDQLNYLWKLNVFFFFFLKKQNRISRSKFVGHLAFTNDVLRSQLNPFFLFMQSTFSRYRYSQ